MTKLLQKLNVPGENPRILAFCVMTVVTMTFLGLLTFKFFSKSGVTIPQEFVGMHNLLLTTYTGAVQGDRMKGENNGYKRMPGELMAVAWVLFLAGFTVLNTAFDVGDRSVLADMWPMPLTLIVGLLSINYVFKQHPEVIKKVAQKIAGISNNGNGGALNGSDNRGDLGKAPPPTPSSS